MSNEIERLQEQLRLCQIDNNQSETSLNNAVEVQLKLQAQIMELERDAEFLRAEIETLQRMRHSQ